MEALGAEVIRTPKSDGMQAAIDYVKERASRTPNSFIAGQFENQDNPDFHYETTGRELYEQLGGQVDAVVIGCGTGGTFTGVARYVKERNPKALAIAVETEGSVLGGGEKGDHEVEGIGASFIPKTFDGSLADEIIAVTDQRCLRHGEEAGRELRECWRDRAREQMSLRRSESRSGSAQASAWRPSFPTRRNDICRREFSSSATKNNFTTEITEITE